ncbi:hypothetical protein EJ08DRAFT_722207 [Tothia fuscella]|uniref:Heterokaryon incompatibility domain-containing protein n=1 Tax=Tothia fuscella TaxID=1048955 RepID=A0A9P4NYV6_9PEZI|nr:hypothetical protein EJ08DRAFT_722207 [Tothia fuscella]
MFMVITSRWFGGVVCSQIYDVIQTRGANALQAFGGSTECGKRTARHEVEKRLRSIRNNWLAEMAATKPADAPSNEPQQTLSISKASRLCRRCKAIEWDLLEAKAQTRHSTGAPYMTVLVSRLETKNLFLGFRCEFCSLIRSHAIRRKDLSGHGSWFGKLIAYAVYHTPWLLQQYIHLYWIPDIIQQDSIIGRRAELAPCPDLLRLSVTLWRNNTSVGDAVQRDFGVGPGSSYIDVQKVNSTHAIRVQEVPDFLDYGVVKKMISSCREGHVECNIQPLRKICGFKLIDCQQRKIVLADTIGTTIPEYLALSYVWGSSSSSGGIPDLNRLPLLPRTIEDAVAVNLGLGFKYLYKRWSIYINLARPLLSPLPARALDTELTERFVSTLKSPACLIQKSKWNTRGWTYQEAILSQRRVVFTEQQHLSAQQDQYRTWDGFPMSAFPDKLSWEFSDFRELVIPYTNRELSYDSDTLNAFKGVLKAFASADPPVHSAWGLPIRLANPSRSWESASAMGTRLAETFALGLAWEMRDAKRRTEFPSWSWAGWKGTIIDKGYRWLRGYDIGYRLSPLVYFHHRDGHVLPWSSVFNDLRNGELSEEDLSTTITIEGWILPFTVVLNVAGQERARFYDGSNHVVRRIRLSHSVLDLKKKTLLGLCIPMFNDQISFVLVVQQKKDKSWERIGIIRHNSWSIHPTKLTCPHESQCELTAEDDKPPFARGRNLERHFEKCGLRILRWQWSGFRQRLMAKAHPTFKRHEE